MSKQDKNTVVKYQYRNYVTQKLERWFGFSKGSLKESTEMEQEVLYYPELEEKMFFKLIYAGHYDKVVLDRLWVGKKFLASGMYASLIKAREEVPRSRCLDVILAVHLGEGRIWFVYESDERSYDGLGGIFVTTEEGCFIIEPIEHYLMRHHPIINDD